MVKLVKKVCGYNIYINSNNKTRNIMIKKGVTEANPFQIIGTEDFDYFCYEYDDGSCSNYYYNSNKVINLSDFINFNRNNSSVRELELKMKANNIERICYIKNLPFYMHKEDILYDEIRKLHEINIKNKK